MAAPYETPDYIYRTDIRPFIDYDVPILEETAPLTDAIAAVGRSPSGTVLLKQPNSRLLGGIITNTDLAKVDKLGTDLTGKTARDIATTSPGVLGIRHDAMLWQLLRLINGENTYHRRFNKVPVFDGEKQIVGLIARDDLSCKMLQMESLGTPG